MSDAERLTQRLTWAQAEAARARAAVREAEALQDGEPLYLTDGIAGFRGMASTACRRARCEGDAEAFSANMRRLILAVEAETWWWSYALRRLGV